MADIAFVVALAMHYRSSREVAPPVRRCFKLMAHFFMASSYPRARFFGRRVVPVCVILGVVGALGWIYLRRGHTLPAPDSSEYKKMVSAFNIGLLALENGDDDRALRQLTLATTIVPLEPAAWADLGIYYLRANNPAKAALNLEKARELAPDNAQIEALLGLLEQQNGDFDKAIAHFGRAVELDPNDLRARYALFGAYSQSGAAGSDAKALEQIEAILKVAPRNQVALLEAARLAAKRGDAAALAQIVAALDKISASWSSDARAQFAELQSAAKTPRTATTPVAFLSNLLKPSELYQNDLAALSSGAASALGTPLTRFLRLAPLEPKSAAPDLQSTFAAQAVPLAPGKYRAARAFYASDTAAAATLYNDGKTVRWAGSKATFAFPFRKPPTPVFPRDTELQIGAATMVPLDWNSDFSTDLVLAGAGGLRFYQSDKSVFRDVTAQTGLKSGDLKNYYNDAFVADIEADGDLDVVLARGQGAPLELRNNGNGTFTATPIFPSLQGLTAWAWADLDDDGDNDIALLDGAGALHVFLNDRSGHFHEREVPADLGRVAALTIGDLDNDGRFDLLVLKSDGALVKLSDLDGGKWTSVAIGNYSGLDAKQGSRLFLADADNNGDFDIIASNGASTRVWLGDNKKFVPLTSAFGLATYDVADINGDGRADLLGVDSQGAASQFMGSGALKYGWLDVRAHALKLQGDGRINSYGIGGAVEVRAVLQYARQPLQTPVAHFGLGEIKCADALRISWPNGDTQAEFDLCSGKDFVARQRLTGSCPYLWAWNGREFAFVKDVNWRSPLGLKINSQDTAGIVQTEDWAHLRSEQLQPHNGRYDLRVTADLWEADIFDSIGLLTVDHPDNTRVWVDERFSIPMPPLGVVVTGPEQPLASLRDERARDVSAQLGALDGDYLDCGRAQYQGVTRDHWVEAQLPDAAPHSGPLWLIAQGWLHPTDSSINVALAQNGGNPPRDLALEVADGRGGWIAKQPHLGFPAGKNKAITVDLSRAFVPGAPRRFRLRTNLEIYWDKWSWASGQPDAPVRLRRLSPDVARLRFRGFSDIEAKNRWSPELPVSYRPNGQSQRWRDLVGFYTRFGDVKPLVARADDRYVIMNAGDEIELGFVAPAPPAPGQTRDTVFMSDGWTKDGNLNTTFSTALLPLPAHNLKQTDAPPTRLQDDPVYRRHRQDWLDYHTRWVGTRDFQNAMRVGLE